MNLLRDFLHEFIIPMVKAIAMALFAMWMGLYLSLLVYTLGLLLRDALGDFILLALA